MNFLFLLLSWLYGWSQSGKQDVYIITYSFELQQFESDPGSIRRGEAVLFSYGDSSIFMDRAQYVLDSIGSSPAFRSLERSERSRVILSKARPVFGYSIYKNYDNESIIYQESVNGTSFSYSESLPNISWEIFKDTATISKYRCQRAIGKFAGRTYEAWYSNEIPIRDGPYKLGGLPGLIFRLQDNEGKIKYELTGIELSRTAHKPELKRSLGISKKEFQKRKDHYYMNRAEYRSNTGTRRILAQGKEESLDEFYEGIKQEYLDWVLIEKE